MPVSGSFSSDHGLAARYVASRNPPNAQNIVEPGQTTFDLSSSPNDSIRAVNISNGRPTPVMVAPVSAVPGVVESGKRGGDVGNGTFAPYINNLSNETTPLLAGGTNDEDYADCRENTTWKKELRVLISYATPVLGTQFLEYSLSIAPVVSIGHISTQALAAATLSTMTASVTGFSLIVGFSTALDTMLPAAWTSGTPSLVGLWSQRMMILMTILMIPVLVAWMNTERILLSLRQEPEIAHLAGLYLRWLCLGLPAYGINQILRRFFQSQGLFSAPTRIFFIVAPINVILNYLLVWGPDRIRLGFIGAPLATSISFNLITILYIIYGVYLAPRTAWHPVTRECFNNLGYLFKIGCAGVVQTASEWWSWEGVALAASQIGPIALAVQSVLLVSASSSYQIPYAISAATAVRIGNMLGAGNARGAALATYVSISLCIVAGAFLGLIFFTFRKNWALIFNDDPAIVKEVAYIMPLVAMFQIFDGLGADVTGAILRAKGQQDIGAALNIIGYYILGIPIGLILAFKFDFGLIGLWMGLTVSLLFCASVGLYICLFRTDWDEEVRKAANRLAQDNDFSNNSGV